MKATDSDFTPATVLITGGAGFIGGTLVRWLLANNPDVRVVTYDALTYAGNLDSLAEVFARHGAHGDGRHFFVKGDICDAAAFSSALDGTSKDTGTGRAIPPADAVIHLAAETHVDRSIMGPAPFITTNVVGTQVVLESVRRSLDELPRPFRMLHVGTDEVYGDGLQVRDWIHAEDHARALWTVLTRGALGRTYHVSAGEQRTNREVITSILRQVGQPESLMTRVTDRLGHDRRYALDNTRLVSELGWHAEHSWEQGIGETVRWYQANAAWWERVLNEAYRAAEALYL